MLCIAGPGWDGPTGLGTPNGVAGLAMGRQGTVSGRVTNKASGERLAGVPVVLTDTADQLTFRAITDSTGRYQVSVSAGTYDVSASKFDYGTKAISGVAVAGGQGATVDIALTKMPEHIVTGKVTDSGLGWPLYAKITIKGDPDGPVHTDPRTGVYSVALPEQADYTMDVTPDYPGYTPFATTVVLGTSELQRNVSVTADPTQCTAPGYAYPAQANFGGWTAGPKYGWTTTYNGTSARGWQFDDPALRGNLTGGTGSFATADPEANGGVAENTDLTSPTFTLAGQKNADLKFNADAVFAAGSHSEADASLTTDGGRTWTPVYRAGNNVHGPVDIRLTQALGHHDVQVRFHFSGQGRSFFQLSNVSVGQCQTLGGGLMEGVVVDANTGQPLNGATVTDGSAPVTDAYATAVSAAAPDDANLTAGFYWLYSPKAGPNALTTTAPRYTTVHAAVTASTGVHAYNPAMPAGRLTVTPAAVSLKTALGSKANEYISLTNTGTAPLKVTVTEQNVGSPGTTPTAPANRSWQSLPDYPATVLDNVEASYEGRTYSIGGAVNRVDLGLLGPAGLVEHSYVYVPGATSWSQIADLPEQRTAAAGAFVDGTLYVVGGWGVSAKRRTFTTESTTYAYHPSSNSWSRVADLPQALSYANAAVFDDKLYVIGGRTAAGSSAAGYRYDPARNTWARIADYPTPADSGGCGGIVNGIVCAGGEIENSRGTLITALASTYVYHPRANTWTRAAEMPYNDIFGSYSSANGELQVAGGLNIPAVGTAITLQRAVQYDPVANAWTNLPDAPEVANGAGRGTGCGLSLIGGAQVGQSWGSSGVRTLPGLDQCGADDVNWLSESMTTVDLAPRHSARIRVSADASVLSAPGDYAAILSMITDSPYLYQPVPVAFQATAPASWAQISGTVTDAATGKPLPGVTIALSCAGRQRITVTTDSLGRYDMWLAAARATVTASDGGHNLTSREVTTTESSDTKVDFALSTT